MSIEHWSTVASDPGTVFDWHARPGALPRLMPPWLPGRVRRQAASLADGRAELALPGGLVWAAQHDPAGFEPGRAFVDERADAGLASAALAAVPWRHEHRFHAVGGHTRMHDTITTPIGSRALRPMLVYRHRQLADDLAAHAAAGAAPMTVAITGASGLIGSQLAAFLSTGGHRVVRLARPGSTSQGPYEQREWDPAAPAAGMLAGVDAVVHLAGASIFGRFGPEHRRRIRDSRIGPTRRLAQAAADAGVRTFVSASAIGRYGVDRGDEALPESATPGDDFLARLVVDWEAEAEPAIAAGIRTVHVRTGLVQTPRGGMLMVLRQIYGAGIGGPLAGGRQWQAWIDFDDLIDVYHRALVDERLAGPVNAVAPEPVRQAEYARTLGRVLRRPALLPTPGFAPALLLGTGGAEELALADQRVVPARLTELGHAYRRPDLEDSLRHQLGRQREAGR